MTGRADLVFQNGMTPLQHAAMKGRADVVRFLLDNGADVNSDHHENSYTTLHFGALSGQWVERLVLHINISLLLYQLR